jgi:hypothetical protein
MKPVYERLMNKIKIPKDKTKCWVWCGGTNNAGFGMIRGQINLGDSKMVTVHRVMARHVGLNIIGNEVQHTCLNKLCVNPDHLVLGSAQDRFDRVAKKHGRSFMRPKNPMLTCEYCGNTTHVAWFSRKHNNCYHGMMDKYNEYMRNKYK